MQASSWGVYGQPQGAWEQAPAEPAEEAAAPAASSRSGFDRLSRRVFVAPSDISPEGVVEELNSVHDMGLQVSAAQPPPRAWAHWLASITRCEGGSLIA